MKARDFDADFNRAQRENAALHNGRTVDANGQVIDMAAGTVPTTTQTKVRPTMVRPLGFALRLEGAMQRFTNRLDQMAQKMDAAEARGNAGLDQQEAYVDGFVSEIDEMEKVMARLGNGVPLENTQKE